MTGSQGRDETHGLCLIQVARWEQCGLTGAICRIGRGAERGEEDDKVYVARWKIGPSAQRVIYLSNFVEYDVYMTKLGALSNVKHASDYKKHFQFEMSGS